MNKYRIQAIVIAAFLAIGGKIGISHMENTKVIEIENSIEKNGFLVGKYGSIDNSKELSSLENKVFENSNLVL